MSEKRIIDSVIVAAVFMVVIGLGVAIVITGVL